MAHHPQDPNRPFGARASIQDHGFFVRRERTKKNKVCCQLLDETPRRGERIPKVDHGDIGVTAQPPEEQRPVPNPYKWYLTIRSYLKFTVNLDRHGDPGYNWYLYDNCCFARNPNVAVTGLDADDPIQATREYGTHLYVDFGGSLCVTDVYKQHRNNEQFNDPQQFSVNDVLPKYRKYCRHGTNEWKLLNVSAVFVFDQTWSLEKCSFIRWWDRSGRQAESRFFETFADPKAYQMLLESMKTDPKSHNRSYYGVYVSGRARLIMTDTLPDGEHNRTLVLGGVFIVVNADFHIAFIDNIFESIPMKRLLLMPELGFPARSTVEQPIVVLNPVPSIAETICWTLNISYGKTKLLGCLRVPLHGWRIPERIQFLDWDNGFPQIVRLQQKWLADNRQREFISDIREAPAEHTNRRSARFDDETVERQHWPHEVFKGEKLTRFGWNVSSSGSGGAGGSGSGTGTGKKRPASGSGGGSAKRTATGTGR